MWTDGCTAVCDDRVHAFEARGNCVVGNTRRGGGRFLSTVTVLVIEMHLLQVTVKQVQTRVGLYGTGKASYVLTSNAWISAHW